MRQRMTRTEYNDENELRVVRMAWAHRSIESRVYLYYTRNDVWLVKYFFIILLSAKEIKGWRWSETVADNAKLSTSFAKSSARDADRSGVYREEDSESGGVPHNQNMDDQGQKRQFCQDWSSTSLSRFLAFLLFCADLFAGRMLHVHP